jgi:hypothetical protein
VARGERIVDRGRTCIGRSEAEGRCSERRGPVELPTIESLLGGSRQELARDPERVSALDLLAAGGENEHLALLSQPSRGTDQCRLADPRRSVDEH